MSTETVGWLVGARDGKKLGSGWDPVNSIPTLSQPGPFQTFDGSVNNGAYPSSFLCITNIRKLP